MSMKPKRPGGSLWNTKADPDALAGIEFKPITREMLDAAIAKIEQERKEAYELALELAQERDEPMGKRCPVCTGAILARYRQPKRVYTNQGVIRFGVGASEGYGPSPAVVEGYHCPRCHIEFNASVAD